MGRWSVNEDENREVKWSSFYRGDGLQFSSFCRRDGLQFLLKSEAKGWLVLVSVGGMKNRRWVVGLRTKMKWLSFCRGDGLQFFEKRWLDVKMCWCVSVE